MNPVLLSVDLGRTSTKACIDRDPNQLVLIPANVNPSTVEEVRRGNFEGVATDPLLDLWLEYQGKGYALGQLAADLGADLGVGQSKIHHALVKILACVGYFNLTGELYLVVGLPYHSQGQFDRDKEELISILRSPHKVVYRGLPITINIPQVWVIPEGYGSLIWSEAKIAHQTRQSFASVAVAIVDIGHQTTDFLMVDRFRFARGVSQSELLGMNQFYEQVAVRIQGADSQSLSLIEAVNRPPGERFYRPRGVLRPTNLDEILPSLQKNFTRELLNHLLAWLPERTTDVIITGGGGEFFWQELYTLLTNARLNVYLAQPCRQANALGQYLYGEVQRRFLK